MITFSGTFTDKMINEIRKKVEKGKNIYVSTVPVSDATEDPKKFQLGSGKVVYVYSSAFGAEESVSYRKFNPEQLKALFSSFMDKKYGYTPEFKVYIDPFIWLPVEIKFFDVDENELEVDMDDMDEVRDVYGDEFADFWAAFQEDMARIQNQHNGGDFEYADKLLKQIFGKEIVKYELVGAEPGSDYVFSEEDGDSCSVLVSFDESRAVEILSDEEMRRQMGLVDPSDVCSAIVNEKKTDRLESYLDAGFDLVEAVAAGMLAIHVAADAGKLKHLKMIVKMGIPIDIPDLGHGYTALGYAIGQDRLEIVEYLLKKGANPRSINFRGDGALGEAKSDEMRKLIERYM